MSCCITSAIVSGIVALLIFVMVLIIVSFKKVCPPNKHGTGELI